MKDVYKRQVQNPVIGNGDQPVADKRGPKTGAAQVKGGDQLGDFHDNGGSDAPVLENGNSPGIEVIARSQQEKGSVGETGNIRGGYGFCQVNAL